MSKEEEFLLKWNNHQNNLVGVFKEWLKDESFVDITLVCGGEIVVGHKVVLAACSPLLSNILQTNPCSHPIVILNDIPSADMRALLKFIYHGEVSVSQSELPSFLRTADNLQIKGLAEEKEEKKKKDEKKRKERDEIPSSRKKSKLEHKITTPHQRQSLSGSKVQGSSSINKKHASKFKSMAVIQPIPNFDESFENSTDSDVNKESFLSHNDSSDKVPVIKTEPEEIYQEPIWHESPPATEYEGSILDVKGNSFSQSNHLSSSSSSPYLPLAIITDPNENSSLDHSEKQEELDLNSSLQENRQDNVNDSFEGNAMGNPEDLPDEDQNCNTNSATKFRGGRKPCCFCGKTFCDNYTLRRHMLTHLARQRQFECSLCSAAYSRKDHLMAHVRRKHLASEYEVDMTAKSS